MRNFRTAMFLGFLLALALLAVAQSAQAQQTATPQLTADIQHSKPPFMKRKPLFDVYIYDGKAFFYAGHSVDLSWTVSPDAVTGSSTKIYKASGSCPATASAFQTSATLLSSVAHPGSTFTDTPVAIGAFCYGVTALVGGAESGFSNLVTALVLPSPPTGLTATPR